MPGNVWRAPCSGRCQRSCSAGAGRGLPCGTEENGSDPSSDMTNLLGGSGGGARISVMLARWSVAPQAAPRDDLIPVLRESREQPWVRLLSEPSAVGSGTAPESTVTFKVARETDSGEARAPLRRALEETEAPAPRGPADDTVRLSSPAAGAGGGGSMGRSVPPGFPHGRRHAPPAPHLR